MREEGGKVSKVVNVRAKIVKSHARRLFSLHEQLWKQVIPKKTRWGVREGMGRWRGRGTKRDRERKRGSEERAHARMKVRVRESMRRGRRRRRRRRRRRGVKGRE